MLLCVQCAFNTCTGVLLAKIISKLFHNRVLTMVGYSIYFFLIGLSPWVSIPYSDSIALVFPILIMYIYVNREKFKCFSWFAIPFLSYNDGSRDKTWEIIKNLAEKDEHILVFAKAGIEDIKMLYWQV